MYSPTTPADIEDTVPISQISTSLAAWANPGPADYTLTSSGATVVGGTRNLSLTYNSGPTNGGPGASGTAYFYISVNGVNLAPITQPFTVAGGAAIPGGTITGSYAITAAGANNIKFRKVYYDIPTFSTRVACNGQTGRPRLDPTRRRTRSTPTLSIPSARSARRPRLPRSPIRW